MDRVYALSAEGTLQQYAIQVASKNPIKTMDANISNNDNNQKKKH